MVDRVVQRWWLSIAVLWLCTTAAVAEQHSLPLFLPATAPGTPQGVLRVLNHSDASGAVSVYAIDDAGTRAGPVTFTLGTRAAAEFDAMDLANGNAAKGLSGSLGRGTGDWRLEIDTGLLIEPMAYVRAAAGTLAVMHDTVRGAMGSGRSTYEVPIFNPSTDVMQVSRLRLINPGDPAVQVTIAGRDDTGAAATGGEVQLVLPAGGSRTLTAQQLEAGDVSIAGRLGAGVGRWRLSVSADHSIQVVNMAVTPSGVWNNLSTTSVQGPAPADHRAFNARVAGLTVVYETDSGRFTMSPQAGEPVRRDGVGRRYIHELHRRLSLRGHRAGRGPADACVRRRQRVQGELLLCLAHRRLVCLALHGHGPPGWDLAGRGLVRRRRCGCLACVRRGRSGRSELQDRHRHRYIDVAGGQRRQRGAEIHPVTRRTGPELRRRDR